MLRHPPSALAGAARHRLRGPRVHPHAQAGSIKCCRRLPSSFDKSEHKAIGSSKNKPAQSAPVMTSGGTVGENIIVKRARTRLTAPVMPIAAVRGALKGAGKADARYPSASPVIADTGKVSRKDAVAHNATKASSTRPAMATATIHTASATSEGPSRRNITVRFIEVDPSFESSDAKPDCSDFWIMPARESGAMAADRRRMPKHPPSAFASTASQVTRPWKPSGLAIRQLWKLPSATARPWRLRCGSPSCRSRACRARSWSG